LHNRPEHRHDIDDGSIDDTPAAAAASVQHGADHTEAEA
jgi:hypothetical protein